MNCLSRTAGASLALVATGLGTSYALTVPVEKSLTAQRAAVQSTSAANLPATTGPGQEAIDEARREAAAAEELLRQQTSQLTQNQDKLITLSEQASSALEAYDQATLAAEEARRQVNSAKDRKDIARAELAAAQDDVSRWAQKHYERGTTNSEGLAQLLALGRGESSDYMTDAWTLHTVGQTRTDYRKKADEARRAAEVAEVEAEQAAARAASLEKLAKDAKKRADTAVAAQQAEVDRLAREVATTQNSLDNAQTRAARLADAQRIADAAREEALRLNQNRGSILGPAGTCAGGNLRGYANGRLPVGALCPLWGAPGHFLRADAANAFEKMSKDYAAQTGQPLCVTDSYRNYETQVSLKRSKPHLAARPGTSNHGWGRAIDFCGGVNRFGHPAHQWMRANAPLYGWFHPSWARQSGSKPEAWHWEYAG